MEAGGSSKMMMNANKIYFNGLIDHLFSWTLEDVLDDGFFKDKVQKIPESFKSAHEYLGYYLFPLLEETRAELSLSLKAIRRAPFAQLVSFEELQKSGKLLLNVSVDSWRNTSNNSGKEPYRTLPGDIFLILDDKPETVTNSQCSTRTWAFAWVRQITDNGCSTHLKLTVSKNISGEHGTQKKFFIAFLMNVTTNLRIWNSLHFSKDAKIIKHVLTKKSMGDEICKQCPLYNNAVYAEKLGSSLSTVLNDSQKAAVLCSVCKTLCDHKPSVELIWGPPGTGKTKTVSYMLWAILEINQRVLACAPTNVAITELASRVVKLLRESFRAGDVSCSLGHILIFGNKDRLKVGSELEEIYLDYRVDRLVECFGQSGWKHQLTSLIKLLESGNSEYLMLLGSNVNTSRRDKKTGDNMDGITSFLGFLRKKFKSTALALRGCLQTLITHIPKKFILEHNFQNIEILLKLLDSFGMLLSQDYVNSVQMDILFSSPEVFLDFPNFSVEARILCLRSQCLSILRTLQASLDQLQLPSTSNDSSVRKFCYQRASLIFCTVSSSFKLSSMKIDPVNMLVIDEAAQLKECEAIIPLQLPGLKHAILIGDECQLPAIVCSQVCDAAGYGRSLFERLSLLGHSKHLLNTQYRMHPSISCFPNSKFYSNQILDSPLVMDKVHKKCYIPTPMFGPYTFINVSVGKEQWDDDDGHSKKNNVEVAVVIKIIEKLYKAWRKAKTRLNIGVISFYAAQVSAIQGKLSQKYEKSDKFSVKVKSVDGFQGGEEDVIILSTVRSNRKKVIGFISNSQRINVALTRARHCLWIVGDATTLGNSDSEWKAVVSDAKIRQCYFNAEEDKDLADAIIEVKKGLLEFDDLLNKDSLLFKMTQWKVLLSDSFRASFQEVVSANHKKLIIVICLRLSCGWRPETDYVPNPKCSKIIKCVKVEGLCIIYSLDIEKDSEYKQILKIWDIKPLTDVKVLVDCLSNIHELYTDDFLNLCKAKSHKGDLELPITWSASHNIVVYKDHMKAELNSILSLQVDGDETKNITQKKNLLQMRFQSLSFQKAMHLLSDRDSKELDFPCQVKDEQLEVILFPTSAFIMGRPGSEKTTALTIKLYMREQQQQIHPGGCSQVTRENAEASYRNEGGEECKKIDQTLLRQLFITVTLKQCHAVKEHLSYFRRNSDGGNILENQSIDKVDVLDMDDAQDLLDVPNSFDGISFNSYPLVITFRKFLIMLDRTVGDSYLVRFQKQWKLSCGKPRDPLSTAAYTFIASKEVTVKNFALSYWSNFDGRLTNKLDAVVVFNEIISQIKGGLGAKDALDGRLSKLDYTRLSKGQSSLSRKQREKIYDIFVDYEKLKNKNGEYDLADLVIDLHHRLEGFQYTGDLMDFVYVDEAQALTMMQITLLKYLCRNVNSGFVFSSNAAQTIAKGIDFRFQDIRFLFFKEFISRVKKDEKDIGAGLMKIPDILHMNQNCRTQPRILQLANSVTDLLYRFFPRCIDILSPEISETSAHFETPVLLENVEGQNIMTVLFEERGNIPADTRQFGAKLVILVRDEHARDVISNLVGNCALVLTILECQCLEFQDVLLYNFFNSSPLGHQWRVIYQYMIEQDMLEILPSSPSFNQPVRMDLCWELKLLHIAITRSRQRLWICEDNQQFSNPIVDYWKKLSYIQVKTLDSSIIQAMKVPSTKEEWSSLGLEFFSEGVYRAASLCFERAEDTRRIKWARAAFLRATSGISYGSKHQMACNGLREAAEIYISMDRAEVAAKCFIELKEYKTAAYVYLTKCGEAKLEDAGDCYMLAECYELAAEAYSRGRCDLKFLNVCTVANLFDMGLQVICSSRKYDGIDLTEKCPNIQEIWHVFLEKGALHYHQLKDFCSMMKFVEAFDSMDKKCSFLGTLSLSEKQLLLEKDVKESTNIMMKKGDIDLEIGRLEKDGNFKKASSLILLYVLFSSLWGCAKKGWPLKLFKRKEKLLTRAKILAMNESGSFYDYVTNEANILSNQTRTLFEMEQSWSCSHVQGSLRGEILSAWRILDVHLSSGASKYVRENKTVTNLREHVRETISLNWISVQTLVYFWNFWKENVLSILKYLQLPESQIDSDYANYEQFCLDYLGVRKQQVTCGNSIYHLFDPEAEWARTVSFEGNEHFVTINSREFVAAAQSYWFSGISSVGLKVLSKLNDLLMLPIGGSLSSYFQAFAAVHIFEMAKFLTEDGYIKSTMDFKNLKIIFELGLYSIQFLRMNQSSIVDLANEIQAVHESSQSFLMSCALHFHEINDSSTMLKFVRGFCSMDLKRSFLKSFNYFNELLSLEMEAHEEALAIAVSRGNLLLEVDLLEKTGNYKEASLLLIFYIYANSLWTSGSKGWPLKEFEHKQKLLEKTKSIAKCDSEAFYDMISVEANILSCKVSGLDKMERSLTASEGHKNLRGIIVSAWKILDAHLKLEESNYIWENGTENDLERHSKETISRNQVSFETLVYFWNLWKDSLIGILDYLCSIDIEDVNGYCEGQQDFCLSHFGVRRQYNNQEALYFLLNPDADWATEVVNEPLHWNGCLVGIAACPFTSAGWRYWSSEVLSTGMRVLEKLKALYSFSASASNSSELCQSMVAINFCEVENFLKNSQFLKCASESLLQNFTDVRLQFILCCKQHLNQGSLVGNIEELEDLKFTFLRKCALHYHMLQDKRAMMKFVEAFHSIDSKRLFLKSSGCFDELLSLEEISGNFMEATAIARLKGDLLLEIDLLEKAGQFEEVVELILFYVLASSLWTTQSKGWPLKQFKMKEKLLLKAKSIAKLKSDVFHRNVCIEAEILSDGIYSWLDMKRHLSSSRENKNICGEILSTRRILDAHLCSNTLSYEWEDEIVSNPLSYAENKISQSQVSIETLSHFWNLWKDYIIRIIKYLDSLGTKNVDDCVIYEGFCLKYLGIRKQVDHQNTYQLLFTDADWITHISLQSVQTNGKLMSMDVEQFALAARSYWSAELLSVGMKVLECLSNIHRFSVMHSLSKFRQCSAAICIFEIANSLISSNLANFPDGKKLHDYRESYADHFFGNVFGLCWIDPLTENMISLRENDLSSSVTEAVILKTIHSKDQLSYEKIGKVVMALLGSGKLTSGLYDKIARKCNVKLHWKSVIDAFNRHMIASLTSESSVSGKVDETTGCGDLVNLLHDALTLTFVNWKKEFGCMPPDCFLYIVERQSFLISMSQGCFYTTRSSFIEWLVHEEWPGRQVRCMAKTETSSGPLFDSIAKMVHELLFNNCGAREWIKRSNINTKEYYPIFLLRLVIIMCLLSANLGKYYDMLNDFIRKPDMHSQLPAAFPKLFKESKKQNLHFLNYLAEAVWKIGNPLVKVCFEGDCKKPVAPAAISIRMNEIGKKDDLWKLLFAKNLMDDHNCGSFSSSGSNKVEPIGDSNLLNSKTSQVLLSANEDVKTDDKMKVVDNISTAKGSSQGLQFQPKHESVWKEKSSQNDSKTEDKSEVPHVMSTAKDSLHKLQLQPKLESMFKETVSQNDTIINDKMKVADNISTAKASSQGLQFQRKPESVWKEKSSQNDSKTETEIKVSHVVSTAKDSSHKLQLQPKLESMCKETVSQNDMATNNKVKVADSISSTAKAPSQGLQFQWNHKSVWKEKSSQNDSKIENEIKVSHVVLAAKDSSHKLQLQPKLESLCKETVSQNDMVTNNKVKVADSISSTAKAPSQGLQFQWNHESVWKEKSSQNDSKIENEIKVSHVVLAAKDSSHKLQLQPKLESMCKGTVSQNDTTFNNKVKVVDNISSTAKASSQGLQFQPKHESVCKEKSSQNDSKTEDKSEVPHVMSTAKDSLHKLLKTLYTTVKDSLHKLQLQPKLESMCKETVSQNDTIINDKMKVADNISTAKASSQGLQFQRKHESLWKEKSSQNDSKIETEIKVSHVVSTAKDSSHKLQLQPKLESMCKETVSQNDMATNNKVKVVDSISSTAKAPSQGLQFQWNHESVWKEKSSQNDSKTENEIKVSHAVLAATDSLHKLQLQPKLESMCKETVSQNDTTFNNKVKVADNISSTAKASSQGLQLQRKHESVGKEKSSQNDSKTENKNKAAHVMSTAKESSHKLKYKPKYVSANKEIAAKNDVQSEKNTMKKAEESTQKLQCKQKLKYVKKDASSSDSNAKKDKMKTVKQKDVKAEKGKQKVEEITSPKPSNMEKM